MGSILEETKFIMKKYNIKANKSLGQNFLISEEVVNSIVGCSEINQEDLIIEIGPRIRNINKILIRKSRKSNLH